MHGTRVLVSTVGRVDQQTRTALADSDGRAWESILSCATGAFSLHELKLVIGSYKNLLLLL